MRLLKRMNPHLFLFVLVAVPLLLPLFAAASPSVPDVYEQLQDNTSATLNVFDINTSQCHTLDTAADEDWFLVYLLQGHSYTITVSPTDPNTGNLLSPTLDLALDLYRDGPGQPPLTKDQSGNGWDETIPIGPLTGVWTAPVSGYYWARARLADGAFYDASSDNAYYIIVSCDNLPNAGLATISVNVGTFGPPGGTLAPLNSDPATCKYVKHKLVFQTGTLDNNYTISIDKAPDFDNPYLASTLAWKQNFPGNSSLTKFFSYASPAPINFVPGTPAHLTLQFFPSDIPAGYLPSDMCVYNWNGTQWVIVSGTQTMGTVGDGSYTMSVDINGLISPDRLNMFGVAPANPPRDLGNVNVNVSPSSATWTLTAGDGSTTSGAGTHTIIGVPIGTIHLALNALANYDAPAQPANQTLVKAGTISFSAAYTRQTGAVNVNVTPSSATWTLTDGDGATTNGAGTKSLPTVPTGNIHLALDPLSNHDAPAPPSGQTLAKDATITFTGTFTRQSGTVNVSVTPANATWALTDGDGVTSAGTGSKTLTGVRTGYVSLVFHPLAYFDTPSQPAPQALSANGTVSFDAGVYVRQTGTVQVNVTPSSATWTLTGGDGATTSGAGAATLSNVPAGNIHLALDPLSNYDTPSQPADLPLAKNGTVTFTKAYTRQTGTVTVNVTPSSATWTLTDGDGATSAGTGAKTLAGVPTGYIHLALNALSNYDTPAPPADQSLAKNGTVTFSKAYVRQTGAVTVNVTPSSATWTLTDGDGATSLGTGTKTLPAVSTGNIRLSLNALVNYDASAQPADQTLADDGAIVFDAGAYTRQTGAVNVNVTPSSATWMLTDGEGVTTTGAGTQSFTGIPTGYIYLHLNALSNNNTPPQPAAQSLAKNGTVSFSAAYTRQTGAVNVNVTPSSATWTLTDGDGNTTTGAGTQSLAVLPGVIQLSLNPLSNHDMPDPPPSQTLSAFGAIAFNAAYTRQTGTVNVNVTPSSATWTLTNGDGGTTTGAGTQSLAGIPTGNIHLALNALNNYTMPTPPGDQTLAKNGTVGFNAAYARQTGSVNVNVTPSSATWTLTDGDGGTTTGAGTKSLAGIPTGFVTLALNPLSNYDTPAPPVPQALAANGSATFNKTYARQTGAVKISVYPSSATWALTDGDGATSTGAGSRTIPGVATGGVTLDWLTLDGYTTPTQPAPQTLLKNTTATFQSVYYPAPGTVDIAVWDGATLVPIGGTVDFGATYAGGPALVKTLAIVTSGAHELQLSSLTVTGGFIPGPDLPATLTAGTSASLTLTLPSATPGAYAGTALFENNVIGKTPYSFAVRGKVSALGALTVSISPAEAAAAGAQWRRQGQTAWHASGETEHNLPPGACTVEFLPLTGWRTPANAPVVIAESQTAAVEGGYVALQPDYRVTIDGTIFENASDTPADFGAAMLLDTPPARVLAIANTGSGALALSGLTLPGGFAAEGALPDALAAGTTCTVRLTLNTATPGVFSGNVEFKTNAPGKTAFALPVTGSVLPVTGRTLPADYQITYKNCQLLDVSSGSLAALAFTGNPAGTVKIQRLVKTPASTADNPAKGLKFLHHRVAVTSVTVVGPLLSFSTDSPIQNLHLSGALATLQTANAFIARVEADVLGKVTMSLTPTPDTVKNPVQTRLISHNAKSALKPKITLTGVGLAELRAPGQTVTLSVSAKKGTDGTTVADAGPLLIAGPALSLTLNGGNLHGDLIAAGIKTLSLKKNGVFGGCIGLDNDGNSLAAWIITGPPDLGSGSPDVLSVNAAGGINASFVCGVANASDALAGGFAATFQGVLKQVTVGKGAPLTGAYWSNATNPKISPKGAGADFKRQANPEIAR